jgi:hypothetical protein
MEFEDEADPIFAISLMELFLKVDLRLLCVPIEIEGLLTADKQNAEPGQVRTAFRRTDFENANVRLRRL